MTRERVSGFHYPAPLWVDRELTIKVLTDEVEKALRVPSGPVSVDSRRATVIDALREALAWSAALSEFLTEADLETIADEAIRRVS